MPSSGLPNQHFDIKNGMSRKVKSHISERNTWYMASDFRFYKGKIVSTPRLANLQTLEESVSTFDLLQSQSCSINTATP